MIKAQRIVICLGLIFAVWTMFIEPAPAKNTLVTGEAINKTFVKFQQMWMEKLARHGIYGPKYMEVKKAPDLKGTYVATYKELGEIKSSQVKKTEIKNSPYIGIIKYSENVFRCRGKTPEEARKGPFRKIYETTITEIFRYAHGKWIY